MKEETKRFIDDLLICLGLVVVMVVLVLLSGCCSQKLLSAESRDSVRVETIYRTEYRTDTAYIEIPKIVERITTKDTMSIIENDYAITEAIVSEGFLTHSLSTKSQERAIEVQTEIITRDSIVFIDKEVEKFVEVTKPLTWWQQTQIKSFWLMLVAIILFILWRRLKSKIGIF